MSFDFIGYLVFLIAGYLLGNRKLEVKNIETTIDDVKVKFNKPKSKVVEWTPEEKGEETAFKKVINKLFGK